MPSTTVRSLRAEAKAKKIPGRSKFKTKAQLLTALGRPQEAKKARREARSLTSSKTAGAIASRVSGDSATRRAQIKGRLLRSVKRDIDAARKNNPDISQEELRKVAGRAFVKEAKRIKAGEKEQKPKRGGARKPTRNPADDLFQPFPIIRPPTAPDKTKPNPARLERVGRLLKKMDKKISHLHATEKEMRHAGASEEEVAAVSQQRKRMRKRAIKLENQFNAMRDAMGIKNTAPGTDFGRGKKLNTHKHRTSGGLGLVGASGR